MIELIPQILKSVCPYANLGKLNLYAPFLNEFMPLYEINSLLRVRHFIAQAAHESGSFNYVEEIASGEDYEWRKDLGNTHLGDGVKYKGRGLIQLTGRNNYNKLSIDFGVDFLNAPELLEQPQYAVRSACWFWRTNGLNVLADENKLVSITRKINGGINGLKDRIGFYEKAKQYIL